MIQAMQPFWSNLICIRIEVSFLYTWIFITSFLILMCTLLKLSGLICNGFVRFVNVTLFLMDAPCWSNWQVTVFSHLYACVLSAGTQLSKMLWSFTANVYFTPLRLKTFWTKEFIFCRLSSFNHNMGVREGVDDTPMIDWWVPQRPSCLKSVSWFFFTTNGTGQ